MQKSVNKMQKILIENPVKKKMKNDNPLKTVHS